RPVILVRISTSPEDVHGMIESGGILTSTGGTLSHAALVARGMGKPCIVGASGVRVDLAAKQLTAGGRVIAEGEELTIDGSTGAVYAGGVPTVAGLPVVIRLIDPPLHEFLPEHEEVALHVARLCAAGADAAALEGPERLLNRVEELREANPMMGLRGCRLGILFPEITRMQV